MTKRYFYLLLGLIMFLALVAGVIGISWGLPSSQRQELLFAHNPYTPQLGRAISEQGKEAYFKKRTGKIPITIPSSLDSSKDDNFVEINPKSIEILRTFRRYVFYTNNPDEMSVLFALGNMNPKRLQFDPGMYQYGGAYLYPTGIFLKLLDLNGIVKLTDKFQFYIENVDEVGKIYIAGRAFVLLSFLLSVFLIGIIGRELFGEHGGLVAALFMSIAPANLNWAHVLKPHLYAIFFVLLCFYFCLLIMRDGKLKWYILVGIFLGLAAGSTINYAFSAGFVIIALYLRYKNGGRGNLKALIICFGIAFLLYTATNIYVFTSMGKVIRQMRHLKTLHPFSPTWRAWLLYFPYMTWYSMGPMLTLFGLLGLLKLFLYRRSSFFLLFFPCLVYYTWISAHLSDEYSNPQNVRFGLLLIPFFCLLAGYYLYELASKRKFLAYFFLLLTLISTAVFSLPYEMGFLRDSRSSNTRMEAGRYINKSIPKGSSIAFADRLSPFRAPPFDLRSYRLYVFSGENDNFRELPDYLIFYEKERESFPEKLLSRYGLLRSFSSQGVYLTGRPMSFADTAVYIYSKTSPGED